MQPQKHRLRFALLLAAFSALGPFTVDMYLASFPEIMNFFETNATMVQASLTASLLGLGFGQIIIGPLSEAVQSSLKTMRNWQNEIINYHRCRWTNAIVEGRHNRIKAYQRRHYFTRNRVCYKAGILIECNRHRLSN